MYNKNWLDKLSWRYGKYAIRNLMTIIVCGMTIVFVLDNMSLIGYRTSLSSLLSFNLDAILHGQIWRLVSFVFIPPDSSFLFILFSLYFYWMIGSALENRWGSFKFNVYYLCGMIGTIISGCITGHATNSYLNLSLFIAFALMYPDYEMLVFFILPVKMKYLALLDAAGLLIAFFAGDFSGKVAIIAAIANVLLFFWDDIADQFRRLWRRYKFRHRYK